MANTKGNELYTLIVNEKTKVRYSAGEYNQELKVPRYEIEISIWNHVKNQVEINQFIMGSGDNCIWVWDIENKSTWPAFIIIKKDGVVVANN